MVKLHHREHRVKFFSPCAQSVERLKEGIRVIIQFFFKMLSQKIGTDSNFSRENWCLSFDFLLAELKTAMKYLVPIAPTSRGVSGLIQLLYFMTVNSFYEKELNNYGLGD